MKHLLCTALLAIGAWQFSSAQVKNIEYSAPFEEPEKGWYKVMQLSNGNTFFFNFNNEQGVSVTVYKPDRKIASKKVLSSNVWDSKNMKNSTMEGIYEIAGQPVIFLQQLNDREPILYRIQLNPENGAVDKQMEIGRLPKYKLMAGYAMAFGDVDPEDFMVEKDPYSDAYAVAHYNSFASESHKRIEVVHYGVENGQHNEISRAFYDPEGFKYINYVGMCVKGNESVYMASYAYNTQARGGGKDSRVIISRIRKGEPKFTHLNIEFTDDFKDTEGMMYYNPYTGTIQLLTITLLQEKDRSAMAMVSYIDPSSLQIVKKTILSLTALNSYIKSKAMGAPFEGMAVNMILNNDHTSTILVEEKLESTINSSSTEIKLKRIGIIKLDEHGKESESYCILKDQTATGHPMGNLYHAKRGKGLWSYRTRRGAVMYTPLDNRPFYSFDYINTETNNTYILFNDTWENYKTGTPESNYKKIRNIKNVSESLAVYRKVLHSEMESAYMYNNTANQDQTAFCNIESSHFRKDTGVYASLMVKRNKREKKAYISWVTFE